jgi:NitT/TauT family transport system substrate-binding protein
VLAVLLFVLGIVGQGQAQRSPELTEIDAWLVRDMQMSSQFAVADKLGYFQAEGVKVNPRWYINGPELPSMWGAGNIHLGTATATMVVPIAANGPGDLQHRPAERHRGSQQIVLGKKGQENRPRAEGPREAEDRHAERRLARPWPSRTWRRTPGVDFNKLQFVNLAPPDAIIALAKGDVDAIAVWMPWAANAVKQAGGKVYFTGNRSYIPARKARWTGCTCTAGVVCERRHGEEETPQHVERRSCARSTRPRRRSTPTARPP